MASKKSSIKFSDLVQKVRANALDIAIKHFYGYPGDSEVEGHFRLYLDMHLNEYLEIPNEDLVYSQSREETADFMGGTDVWIKKNSTAKFKMMDTTENISGDQNSEWFSRDCFTIGTCTNGPVCNYTNGCPKRTEPGYHPLCKNESDKGDNYLTRDCWTQGSCTKGIICKMTQGDCPGRTQPGYPHPYCPDRNGGMHDEWFSRDCFTIGTCTNGPVCNYTNGCPAKTEPGYHPLCKQDSDRGDNYFTRDCWTHGTCTKGIVCKMTKGDCPGRTEPGYPHPYCPDRNGGMHDEWFSRDCFTIGTCTNGPVCNFTNGCPGRTEPGYSHPYCPKNQQFNDPHNWRPY